MTKDDFIGQLVNGVKDFSGADLHGLDFSHLYLEGLNFKGANLSGCDLQFTDLISCNFENANLSNAKMRNRTVLYKVNLTNVNLDDASIVFDSCIFVEIEIDANTMDKYFPSICPSKGEFIGWKKAFIKKNEDTYYPGIVKLLIPSDAKRCSVFRRKCRCDKAKVISIECLYDPDKLVSVAYGFFDSAFKYELGKKVSVDNFDADRRHGCAPGIYFFMTREEAVEY